MVSDRLQHAAREAQADLERHGVILSTALHADRTNVPTCEIRAETSPGNWFKRYAPFQRHVAYYRLLPEVRVKLPKAIARTLSELAPNLVDAIFSYAPYAGENPDVMEEETFMDAARVHINGLYGDVVDATFQEIRQAFGIDQSQTYTSLTIEAILATSLLESAIAQQLVTEYHLVPYSKSGPHRLLATFEVSGQTARLVGPWHEGQPLSLNEAIGHTSTMLNAGYRHGFSIPAIPILRKGDLWRGPKEPERFHAHTGYVQVHLDPAIDMDAIRKNESAISRLVSKAA